MLQKKKVITPLDALTFHFYNCYVIIETKIILILVSKKKIVMSLKTPIGEEWRF